MRPLARARAPSPAQAALYQPRGEMVALTQLPDECLLRVLAHLSMRDVMAVACTAKPFAGAVQVRASRRPEAGIRLPGNVVVLPF